MRTPVPKPFDGPEFDTAPADVPERTQTYVVCATPRSGSTLLCRSLAASGVAGIPLEYFDSARRSRLGDRWGCGRQLDEYVDALKARRTSHTGVLGIKLHWNHIDAIRAETLGRRRDQAPFEQPAALLDDLFGGPLKYIHIMRRDVDRQAVSLWTAQATGIWNRPAPDAAPKQFRVRYSFRGIRRCRHRIALGELHWDRFFRFNGICPVEVVYEDLCAAHASEVARVLDELVPGATAEIAPPLTAPLADSRSEKLLERFRSDVRSRHPLSPRERLAPYLRRFLPWR